MSDDIERLRRGDLPYAAHVPLPQRFEPDATASDDAAVVSPEERTPWAAVIGTILLAVLACVPHLVAPALAIVVALVCAPLSWSLHRVSEGRRKRAYIALAGMHVLILGLAVAATFIWVQLGVVQLPQLTTG